MGQECLVAKYSVCRTDLDDAVSFIGLLFARRSN